MNRFWEGSAEYLEQNVEPCGIGGCRNTRCKSILIVMPLAGGQIGLGRHHVSSYPDMAQLETPILKDGFAAQSTYNAKA